MNGKSSHQNTGQIRNVVNVCLKETQGLLRALHVRACLKLCLSICVYFSFVCGLRIETFKLV